MSAFEATIKEHECDGKIKQMSVRTNSNMLDLVGTKAQIAANALEKGISFSQAPIIVNEYCSNEGKDKVSES